MVAPQDVVVAHANCILQCLQEPDWKAKVRRSVRDQFGFVEANDPHGRNVPRFVPIQILTCTERHDGAVVGTLRLHSLPFTYTWNSCDGVTLTAHYNVAGGWPQGSSAGKYTVDCTRASELREVVLAMRDILSANDGDLFVFQSA